jgi:hypothetical protein
MASARQSILANNFNIMQKPEYIISNRTVNEPLDAYRTNDIYWTGNACIEKQMTSLHSWGDIRISPLGYVKNRYRRQEEQGSIRDVETSAGAMLPTKCGVTESMKKAELRDAAPVAWPRNCVW